jgi:hypothetical protein
MGLHEKYIGIDEIVDYLYHIGISDENDQDLWINTNLNYKTYSLSDESALFVYDYIEENLNGMDIEKKITDEGVCCLMWVVERFRPVSSGYEKPY